MSLGKTLAWLLVLGPWAPAIVLFALSGQPTPAWYTNTHPLVSLAIALFAYSTLLYFISIPLRNCSIYDFNWSLLPAAFVLHYAYHPMSASDPVRQALVIGVIWFWSARLTGNWLIKGGLAHEDFRYVNYRKQMSPAVFQLFAFVVLFLVQSAMVMSMTLPAYIALSRGANRPAGVVDFVAAAIVVVAVLIEWAADVQTLRFRRQRDANPGGPRFLTTGLWRYSRHPNYFGEIMVWWGVYLFAVGATGDWLQWTIVGPLTITGLFLGGSVNLTEKNELARKPEYAEYQRTTSKLIPWPPKAR